MSEKGTTFYVKRHEADRRQWSTGDRVMMTAEVPGGKIFCPMDVCVVEDKAMRLDQVKIIADHLVHELEPACERICIAGSIRRQREYPNDIDLVVIPRYRPADGTLFETGEQICLVDEVLAGLEEQGRIQWLTRGPKCKAGTIPRWDNLRFDIYATAPDAWATTLLIRTGSREFNIGLCQRARQLGLTLHVDGSGLLDVNGRSIELSDERSILTALHLRWCEPTNREQLGYQSLDTNWPRLAAVAEEASR